MSTPLVFDGPDDADLTVALAHGAGAPMDSPFMVTIAAGLARAGLRVVRFEFPYMRKRRIDGTRRPPDRAPVLLETWRAVIATLGPGRLVIGGKSLGGRIASLLADQAGVRALVCLGYPFHAPGRPATPERLVHMAALATPTLIVQGERDTLGAPAEVAGYTLSPAIDIAWMIDGDHSLKPRKASGRSEADNLADAIAAVVAFAGGL